MKFVCAESLLYPEAYVMQHNEKATFFAPSLLHPVPLKLFFNKMQYDKEVKLF